MRGIVERDKGLLVSNGNTPMGDHRRVRLHAVALVIPPSLE
jgi:hypothetical protein